LSSSIFASAALRSSEAISCITDTFKKKESVGRLKEKTDLAAHSCKRLGGYIAGCNAPAQAGVVLIFEVYKQRSDL
jgi:hypothetical protein